MNVLVGIPRDLDAPPDLAQRWDDELSTEFDRDLVVRVGFLEAQVSGGERQPTAPSPFDQRPPGARSPPPSERLLPVAGPD